MTDNVISVAELKEKLKQNKNLMLIDVRSQQEREAFNIGGELIPLQELAQKIETLDRGKEIITYCHTGARSLMAANMLKDAGFTSVKSLVGGMMAWQATETETADS